MEKVKGRECFRIEYPNTPAGKKDWNKRFSDNAYYAGKHLAQRNVMTACRLDMPYMENAPDICVGDNEEE